MKGENENPSDHCESAGYVRVLTEFELSKLVFLSFFVDIRRVEFSEKLEYICGNSCDAGICLICSKCFQVSYSDVEYIENFERELDIFSHVWNCSINGSVL